jgi:hypothetical protein
MDTDAGLPEELMQLMQRLPAPVAAFLTRIVTPLRRIVLRIPSVGCASLRTFKRPRRSSVASWQGVCR